MGGARTLSQEPESFLEGSRNSTNTESGVARQVRVEVHMSNGVEFGHTTPTNMNPGQVIDVRLSAVGQTFTTWSAHVEVG